MDGHTNGRVPIDRTRLCQLAQVSRGKHIRWTNEQLLSAKPEYGELDLIRAAILDELTLVAKPSVAKTAWQQIEQNIDVLKPDLQVVIAPTTARAHAIHNSTELDRLLPRNEPVIVIALDKRVERARARLREFRTNTGERHTPPAPTLHIVPSESAG
jgi:hypothetical protein